MPGTRDARDAPQDCGVPTCDACHPPRRRCEACGALHADPDATFCSLECALAGGDGATRSPEDAGR